VQLSISEQLLLGVVDRCAPINLLCSAVERWWRRRATPFRLLSCVVRTAVKRSRVQLLHVPLSCGRRPVHASLLLSSSSVNWPATKGRDDSRTAIKPIPTRGWGYNHMRLQIWLKEDEEAVCATVVYNYCEIGVHGNRPSNLFHTYAVRAAFLCSSTTAQNRTKPQIYREDRERTALTASKTWTVRDIPQDSLPPRQKYLQNRGLNRISVKGVLSMCTGFEWVKIITRNCYMARYRLTVPALFCFFWSFFYSFLQSSLFLYIYNQYRTTILS